MENFNKNIIEYCEIENKIKSKSEDIKEMRIKKDSLEKNVIEFIESNNLQDNIFNISSLDTKLKYVKSNTKESITYKFLETTLSKYFNNDSDKVNDILNFIKNNRNSSSKVSLKIN